jgi:hypothetical protein
LDRVPVCKRWHTAELPAVDWRRSRLDRDTTAIGALAPACRSRAAPRLLSRSFVVAMTDDREFVRVVAL